MKTEKSAFLKVATYNIHKGVQGFGPARRLEIHNLGLAIEQLDADIVCLQEAPLETRSRLQRTHPLNLPCVSQLANAAQ